MRSCWGGKYISMCKICGKIGGPKGMLPREILILDLLLDTIWWNLGLFLHKHNLPCMYCAIKAFIIDVHVNRILSMSKGGAAQA